MNTVELPDLKKMRDIIHAVIDYNLEKYSHRIIIDKIDDYALHFDKSREKAEKAFKSKKAKTLARILSEVLEISWSSGDLHVAHYIEEKTDHVLDLYSGLGERIEKITKANRIKTKAEYRDVTGMIGLLKQDDSQKEQLNLLVNLLKDYEKGSFICNVVELDQRDVQQFPSPDGRKFIQIIELEMTDNRTRTIVDIRFSDVAGGATIYNVYGKNLGIKPEWTDENTCTINTRRDYEVITRASHAQCLDQAVKIIYLEY